MSETRTTYERLAPAFAARWAGQDPMAEDRRRFRSLLGYAPDVLDLGCGPGRDLARFRAENAPFQLVGLDGSAAMLAESRKRSPWTSLLVQADFTAPLPFRASMFDGVWACASLLHVRKLDMIEALSEVARVLRPRGVLYVSLKEGDGEDWQDSEHGRRFFAYWRPDELATFLDAAGFTIEDVWTAADVGGRPQRWTTALARA